MSISREEFKKQVRARREARDAKFARLRIVAQKYPRHVSAAIIELANAFHEVGEGMHALNENLGLAAPPKTASLAVRAEAAKKYAEQFRALADENPEEMAVALNDIYSAVNELADGVEALAENTGVELMAPVEGEMSAESPAEELAEGHETLEGPQFVEEELQEAEEAAAGGDMEEAAQEAHDAEQAAEEAAPAEEIVANSGSDAFVTDRDESGAPKAPVTANAGPGAAGWVSDRDENGQPRAPKAAFLKKRKSAAKPR